ncbi:hypothetical protein TTRE_0000894901 [Trichuris trichiura]|uniref:DnaJ homologue subfamily C GRV2/DNAJC13 N-terminal domain-containing protein n=1 Tax=Trichuris trichiura TaxID=36087 RepID=A0A077ZJH8_TRITR|nr:hypothetical protein TTRE_0000894901 [Trichuris trichiura]
MTVCQLSRHLIALWTTGNLMARELLQRIMPEGLLLYLNSTDRAPPLDNDLSLTRCNSDVNDKNYDKLSDQKENLVVDRLIHVRKAVENQLDFLFQHWFHRRKTELQRKDTRQDLKVALENELQAFERSRETEEGQLVCWNYWDFEVHGDILLIYIALVLAQVFYQSLEKEICVDNHYLRLFVGEQSSSDVAKSLTNPKQFFYDVYHRYLSSTSNHVRCLCLRALSVTYEEHFVQIGAFSGIRDLVSLLSHSADLSECNCLLNFIGKLALLKANVKEIINANGLELLVELASLAHLDRKRKQFVVETNVIEFSKEDDYSSSKEWFYRNEKDEEVGPVKCLFSEGGINSSSLFRAQGLEGWKRLEDIAQFRWTLIATGVSSMSETAIANFILNLLTKIVRFFPSRDPENGIIRPPSKVRQILTSSQCLPHIVQLFLTFEPNIVAKTAVLLSLLITDSIVLPRLYLTGIFFFALMYSGSNILEIFELFKSVHMKQAFCSVQIRETLPTRSILHSLLPEAAIYYFENYGVERFSEIFLGEFDNPEIIWNTEMRRYMIERIASHVADFSVRLPSNVQAVYQYCPMVSIVYEHLKNELFCHKYYLKHLCDTIRFPDWPIVEPVKLLQSCLVTWKAQMERKDPLMTVEQACDVLEITYDDWKYIVITHAVNLHYYFPLEGQSI